MEQNTENRKMLIKDLIDLASECEDRIDVLNYICEVADDHDISCKSAIVLFDELYDAGRIEYRENRDES